MVTSSGMRSSSISWRTKSKSGWLAEGNPTSISLKPMATSVSNIRRLRTGSIGSMSAWLPSRRSTAHQRGAFVSLRSGHSRWGSSSGTNARYFSNGIFFGCAGSGGMLQLTFCHDRIRGSKTKKLPARGTGASANAYVGARLHEKEKGRGKERHKPHLSACQSVTVNDAISRQTLVRGQCVVEPREEASEIATIDVRPIAQEVRDALLARELDRAHDAAARLRQADQRDAPVARVGAPQDESCRLHRRHLPRHGRRVEPQG